LDMKFKWRNILFVAGMFLLVILLMDFSRRMDELDRLSKQLESVRAEATAVVQTQVSLMTQVAYSSSDNAVEEWAYEDGKWVRPGEHLVEIVSSEEATPAAEPVVSVPDQSQPNWRTWWDLFFGIKP
jgi:cell division protein FtsB